MKLSVVVAAYNERENIETLTRRLDRALRSLKGAHSEVIFVVEGEDGTKEVLERLARELGHIRILYREEPSGLGGAFRRGFAAVTGDTDFVVTLDADLNHQPEEIPRLLAEIERRKADILVGSRFVPGSRREGFPLWKRLLSVLMNRVIGLLFGVGVRDKTSGFRVYRADALRAIASYKNNDFAFLPEILVHARERGLVVAETPIHFIFRRFGKSKMAFWPTSKSYGALLRTRFDRWTVCAIVLLSIGATIRAAYAFPLHKYVPDADSLLTGLRAFAILDGHPMVFYSGVRHGAMESYLHAAVFSILGVSREAISVAPLLSGFLVLLFFFLLVRELFSRQWACAALLFLAVPSPAYLYWTYMPNGYPETMLLCVATLWLSARAARKGEGRLLLFALGASAGLGLWNSLLTLVCTVPAFLWLLRRRRELFRRFRFLLPLVSGLLLGAAPWLLYNLVHPFASFRGPWSARPADGLRQILENASYFATHDLKELLLGWDPLGAAGPRNSLQRILRVPAAAIYVLSGLVFLTGLVFRRQGRDTRRKFLASSVLLLVLVGLTTAAFDILSEFGGVRGLTVRYVLPLYPVAAVALASLVILAASRTRVIAALIILVVMLFNAAGYYWPGSPEREQWAQNMRVESRLVSYLERTGIRWVCGDYWSVYPLTFLSEERIQGIPYQPLWDYYGYTDKLPDTLVKWALISRDPKQLHGWIERARLAGATLSFGSGLYAFLPDANPPQAETSRQLVALLRRAMTGAPRQNPRKSRRRPRGVDNSLTIWYRLCPGDTMKLSAWAKQQGIDYKTAYRWFRAGILPVPSRQFPTGTILVDPPASVATGAVLYARVSAAGQKADLDRQLARLVRFAGQAGLMVVGTIAEIGGGLNGKRPRLLKLLSNGSAGSIVVEHRDRLARFGSEYIEAALHGSGRRLVVVDQSEMKDDLVQDMIEVLTSFCARLYGRRSAKKKALKAIEATK